MAATREHFERPIRDGNGLLLPGCSVRLLEPGTTDPITDTIYAARTGVEERTNPWTTDTGVVDFYLQKPKIVRIGVVQPGGADEIFYEDIEVGSVDLAREVLAFSIAGIIAVQTGTLRLYVEADGEIERVRASVGTPPAGSALKVDVNLNGTSIFTPGGEVSIAAGANTGFVDLTTPVVVAANDYLTVDVDQVGSTTPGSHLTVQVRMVRY